MSADFEAVEAVRWAGSGNCIGSIDAAAERLVVSARPGDGYPYQG
jgi:hypothetical protein